MCGPLVSSLVAPSGSSIFAIMLCEGTFHEAARAPRRSRGSGHSGSRRESEERPLFGYQPRCSGISGRRPQRCRNGRNRARPRQKNRGILPGTRRSAPRGIGRRLDTRSSCTGVKLTKRLSPKSPSFPAAPPTERLTRKLANVEIIIQEWIETAKELGRPSPPRAAAWPSLNSPYTSSTDQ
jgi:hypothetical protein